MTTFQKILIAIPCLLYIGFFWVILSLNKYHFDGFISQLLIPLPFVLLIGLVLSILIHVISLYRISITGGAIISLWISAFFLIIYLILGLLGVWDRRDTDISGLPLDRIWQIRYDQKGETVDSSARKFVDDSLLSNKEHIRYFQVLKPLVDDSSHYAVYYFYADRHHPDTSSVMAICMIADSFGHILSHEYFSANNNPKALKIFRHRLATIYSMTKMIKITESRKPGSYSMNKEDSVFVNTSNAESLDTIKQSDIPIHKH